MDVDKTRSSDFHYVEWPFYWLTRTSDLYTHHLERALKKIGLDIPKWRVLMQLKKGHYVAVSSLATHALVKLPTMIKVIQRMQDDELVYSRPSTSDGRVTEVGITKLGLKARADAWTEVQRIGHAALADMSEARLETLHALLDRLFDNLGPLAKKPPRKP